MQQLDQATYRQATSADIPAMSVIRLAVKENALTNPLAITQQMYEDYLDKLGRGWVCELDGSIVGFSYADKQDDSIWALFIAPEYEGHGIGKALLKLAVDWLFVSGASAISLGTTANTRADRFYLAQGWMRGDMKNAKEVGYTLQRPASLDKSLDETASLQP